ncbi:hypothetical protein JTZ62_05025 [Mammaliicoccus sciuri]|uniref:hypothetical protein n=1 Tax=Mammaliicoccus sciuri TaxID=1296 RepID=UPI0019D368A3|nr:hypothetical protein [Mammaliicoccus sciuri]QSN68522.1 hypothetical protein JTZ62_05025 [Mammaliicoccus sciuri]UIU23264.1 hypothetical protein LLZ87_05040 [Mammaliicoccus sciuri]UIU26170.1 hypothetical protein LLZ92_05040 [Mammaliicoccus sciuri]
MVEAFIGVIAIIFISLIGYISILHNNHKAEVEELKRELETKDRAIDKYIIKELETQVKNDNKSTSESHFQILSWEESTVDWIKRHEDRYDFISMQHKKFDDEPYIVIKYKIKNSKDVLKNNDHAHMNYKVMWEELKKDVNDAINNPYPKVKPIVKASAMKIFENTLDDMDRLEKEFLNEKN